MYITVFFTRFMRFSEIAGKATKACVKKDIQAAMTFASTIKKTEWKDGKAIRESNRACLILSCIAGMFLTLRCSTLDSGREY